jgi:hypothetical protein
MAKENQCPNGAIPDPKGTRACIGSSVTIAPRSFGTEIEVSRFLPHGSFTFTSPNAIPAKDKSDKRKCITIQVDAIRKKNTKTSVKGEKYKKTVKLPYACPPGTSFARGRCSDGSEPTPHLSCGSRGAPCATARQTCPVQFVFKAGEPHLRFCGERGQKAPLVRVSTPEQAQELATKACTAWERSTKRYPEGAMQGKKKIAGQIKKPGRYTPDIYKAPLGGLRRR